MSSLALILMMSLFLALESRRQCTILECPWPDMRQCFRASLLMCPYIFRSGQTTAPRDSQTARKGLASTTVPLDQVTLSSRRHGTKLKLEGKIKKIQNFFKLRNHFQIQISILNKISSKFLIWMLSTTAPFNDHTDYCTG